MSTFGKIKTNIENTASEIAKNPKLFKRFIFEFNALILKDKDLSEIYYIYDDLSSNKGILEDLANDYINESIEYTQVLIENREEDINELNLWVESWNKNSKNDYNDIDNLIYNNSIKNLESILESKKNIKNKIIKEDKTEEFKKDFVNVPISTMVKVYENSLKNKLNLSESEISEIKSLTSLSVEDLKNQINDLKESITTKLQKTLNESKEDELSNKINDTIKKINESKYDYFNLYKLKELNSGL